MGLKSRSKGKDGERELAELLRPLFPGVRRKLGQERDDGGNGRDLEGTDPFVIQVKRHAQVPRGLRIAALLEAEDATRVRPPGPSLWPLAICRADHDRWTVTCRLGTLIECVGDRYPDDMLPRIGHIADDALVVDMTLDDFMAWWAWNLKAFPDRDAIPTPGEGYPVQDGEA